MFDESAFLLLSSVLYDAFQLNICYFHDWYQDIASFDGNLRTALRNPQIQYNAIRALLPPLRPGEIVSLQDALFLRYILIRGAEKRDFYSIGPFRSQPLGQRNYTKIQNQNHLSVSAMEELKSLTSNIPTNVKRTTVLAIAENLLDAFYHMTAPGITTVDCTENTEGFPEIIPKESINARAKRVEEIYQHESRLSYFVAEGDLQKSLQEARFFSQAGMKRNFQSPQFAQRSFFYAANTVLRKAAQTVNVHPLFLDEISQNFAKKISLCCNHSQLQEVYLEMVTAYCKLCRDQSMGQYSANGKKIISYILLNLNTDLSSAVVGLATGFSPGYVSRTVKEQTGITLSQLVTQERVRVAKRLLQDSSMNISEISAFVGIPDSNYFTKLFRKKAGCTPSEYRKTH